MNKKTLTTVAITAVVVLMLRNKLLALPGVNKLPTL